GIAKLGERPRRDRPGGLVLVFVVLVGRGHLAQRRRVHGGQPVFGNAAPRIGGLAARLLGRIQWFRFRQRLFGVDAVLTSRVDLRKRLGNRQVALVPQVGVLVPGTVFVVLVCCALLWPLCLRVVSWISHDSQPRREGLTAFSQPVPQRGGIHQPQPGDAHVSGARGRPHLDRRDPQ